MIKASESFQIFAKPTGPLCNLGCGYCYYLNKDFSHSEASSSRMSEELLESYISQHIKAYPDEVVFFSWHGGEPTLPGLDFFKTVVRLQRQYLTSGQRVLNGVQTNGVLLNEDWCRFFSAEHFVVGLSLDGPREFHDAFRRTKNGKSVFDEVIRGYALLQQWNIPNEILCVIHSLNAGHPMELYRFFRELGARYITFLPLVQKPLDAVGSVTCTLRETSDAPAVVNDSVSPEVWGDFLCSVFDEWVAHDIGEVQIQIIEEALRTAFGQEHSLCVFRPVCGRVPVVEHNGDFYCCDHFVDASHKLGNVMETDLVTLLESPEQRAFGMRKYTMLPQYCLQCEVLDMCHGACPKDRFLFAPDGAPGLNYLCAGYKKFFNHCRPFVEEVARVHHSGF